MVFSWRHVWQQNVLGHVLLFILVLYSYTVTTNSQTLATTEFSTTSTKKTAPTPVPCDFSVNCSDETVYYWMRITIKLKEKVSNYESNITKLVRNHIIDNLNECISFVSTAPPSTMYTVLDGNNTARTLDNMIAETNSLINGTEKTSKNVDILCSTMTKRPKETTCEVVLMVDQIIRSCCINKAISNISESFIKDVVVENQAERVAKGICGWNASSAGFEKCNGSLSLNDHCKGTDKVFCSERSETAYISLGIPDQVNCSINSESHMNYCYCAQYCSSKASYYSFDINTTNQSLNIRSLILDMLGNTTCNISDSVCQDLKDIFSIYENLTVQCESDGSLQVCIVIIKLRHAVSLCLLSSALLSVFQNQSSIQISGSISRVAICSWENSTDVDLLKPGFKLFSINLNSSEFCQVQSLGSLLNYCNKGKDVTVLLMESCNKSPGTVVTTNATEKAEGLLSMSQNASAMNSTQVENLVSQLESLLSGPSVSVALGNTTINIVSNLLDAQPKSIASSSNRIIHIVDTISLKLVVQGMNQSILSPSVALAVKPVTGTDFQQMSFVITDPFNLQMDYAEAKVPMAQGSITLPASLTQNITPEQQKLVSRVQFVFYQKDTLFMDPALNQTQLISRVLASSVSNLSISNLKEDVIIMLKNTEQVMRNSSISCVFWDFGLNGGSGGWSSKGCTVLNHNENETICGCNHLTSFGVLLDISGEGINNPLQATILSYITYVGCGISAIFLSVTLLTYLAFEKLRKDIPSKIVIHLCLALLMLNLVFLVDAWLALYPKIDGLCISTAFFLHYFLLASFTWMALESVYMYIAIVKVFTYFPRLMVKLGLVGWGIPLVVVIIVIAINKDNYGLESYGKFDEGTDDICWLKNYIAFYVAVVAYFCVVFILNLSMFIVVMVQLHRIKKQNQQNQQHRSNLQELRSVAGLTVLLGLTWGFAFFAWGPANIPFMYLFSIFNSLQGLFIFVFHCSLKENVRRQWKMYLCCGKWRLADNSDSSHTATQRPKKYSVKISAFSFRSLVSAKSNNSSSSTTFLANHGSDKSLEMRNPLDDSPVPSKREPRTDVVLNDFNHRYRNQKY